MGSTYCGRGGILKIIIKGDSKLCFDTLDGEVNLRYWKTNTLLLNALEARKHFVSRSFCWVFRELNSTAHALAKCKSSLLRPV